MPEKQERPTMPALNEPVPSFDAPSHIESTWVEKIDITSTKYQKFPRGTLYKDVVGGDASSPFAKDILTNHPTAFLLREIVSPRTHPFGFRYWGLGETLITKTIGQPNLTPEKYRRLIRRVETDQPVAADYLFPNGLTGDQVQVKLQQETIEEARLQTISEIIAIGSDPLRGSEFQEWGELAIFESVVKEGSAIDQGYPILTSKITPFGNGNAVKITSKYLLGDFVISVAVINGGSGYTSAPTVVFASGSAAATAKLTAGVVTSIEVTTRGSGYGSAPGVSFSGGGGTGAAATAYLGIAVFEEQDYDQRLDVVTPTERYLAPLGSVLGDRRKEVRALNKYLAEVRTIGVNTAVLDAFVFAYPGRINVDMPDKLVSVTGLIEKTVGSGSSSETGSSSLTGNGSVSQSLRAAAQASASIIPEAYPGIKQFWGNNIPCTHYHFFLPTPTIDPQVLNRLIVVIALSSVVAITIASPGVVPWNNHGLANGETVMFKTTGALPTGLVVDTLYYVVNKTTNTFEVSATQGGASINTSGSQSGVHTAYRGVSDWPKFNPELVTLVMLGGRASVQATASSQGSSSVSGVGSSSAAGGGTGYSQETGLTFKTLRISPTIHGVIAVSGTTSSSQNVSAHADSEAAGLGPPETQTTGPFTVSSYISPSSIPATLGATDWPTVGLFLYRTDPSPYRYGYIQFHCIVVDAAKFPNA